ncbi:MAG: hypothetical protein ACR2O4_00195 [Hyphomicrobiaceae bacterium]
MTRLFSIIFLLSSIIALPANAQSKAPKDVYLAYNAALETAKSFDDITPYLVKESVDGLAAMSEKDKTENFGLLKIFGTGKTGVKILKETIDGDNATVIAEFCSQDGNKGKVTTPMKLEEGSWKMAKSNSTTSLEKCDG